MNNRQVIGLIGSILLFFGAFTPKFNVVIFGNKSFISDDPVSAGVMLAMGAISFGLVLMKKYPSLQGTAFVAVLATTYSFVNLFPRMREAESTYLKNTEEMAKHAKELGMEVGAGYSDMASHLSSYEWGWGVVIVGIILTYVAGILSDPESKLPKAAAASVPPQTPTQNINQPTQSVVAEELNGRSIPQAQPNQGNAPSGVFFRTFGVTGTLTLLVVLIGIAYAASHAWKLVENRRAIAALKAKQKAGESAPNAITTEKKLPVSPEKLVDPKIIALKAFVSDSNLEFVEGSIDNPAGKIVLRSQLDKTQTYDLVINAEGTGAERKITIGLTNSGWQLADYRMFLDTASGVWGIKFECEIPEEGRDPSVLFKEKCKPYTPLNHADSNALRKDVQMESFNAKCSLKSADVKLLDGKCLFKSGKSNDAFDDLRIKIGCQSGAVNCDGADQIVINEGVFGQLIREGDVAALCHNGGKLRRASECQENLRRKGPCWVNDKVEFCARAL